VTTSRTDMTSPDQLIPALPGGISVTHLRVYDSVAPDGLRGGSPHMHFACSEAYFVAAGQGAVQTLCQSGFQEVPLRPGSIVWFTPGLIHRLINHDGRLEIYVVMENAGLPERGDSLLTFAPHYLRDERTYLNAASLSPTGEVFANSAEAARHRRDMAVEGFLALRQAFASGGASALSEFYDQAVQLMKVKAFEWRQLWEAGPASTIRRTASYLDALAAGSGSYLSGGAVCEIAVDPENEMRKLGFCGTLRPYFPEGIGCSD
jgi:mannose-6-phosphate isomerase-like protein (cupin superfamily)